MIHGWNEGNHASIPNQTLEEVENGSKQIEIEVENLSSKLTKQMEWANKIFLVELNKPFKRSSMNITLSTGRMEGKACRLMEEKSKIRFREALC